LDEARDVPARDVCNQFVGAKLFLDPNKVVEIVSRIPAILNGLAEEAHFLVFLDWSF
jgi:hypothetical protein